MLIQMQVFCMGFYLSRSGRNKYKQTKANKNMERADQRSPLRYFKIKQRKGIRNKRAWIRIFEAVIALLLIIGVVLTLASKGYLFKEDVSEKVYELQIGVLREIEKDQDLRQEILKHFSSRDVT